MFLVLLGLVLFFQLPTPSVAATAQPGATPTPSPTPVKLIISPYPTSRKFPEQANYLEKLEAAGYDTSTLVAAPTSLIPRGPILPPRPPSGPPPIKPVGGLLNEAFRKSLEEFREAVEVARKENQITPEEYREKLDAYQTEITFYKSLTKASMFATPTKQQIQNIRRINNQK